MSFQNPLKAMCTHKSRSFCQQKWSFFFNLITIFKGLVLCLLPGWFLRESLTSEGVKWIAITLYRIIKMKLDVLLTNGDWVDCTWVNLWKSDFAGFLENFLNQLWSNDWQRSTVFFFLLFYHNLRRITRILSKTYPCFKKNDFVHITIPVYWNLKQILSCSCQHFYLFTPLKDIKQRKKWMYEIIVILFLLIQYDIIKMSNTFCIAPINRLELFTRIRKWKKNLLISNKV